MARTKVTGRTMVRNTVWKRNKLLCRPIGRSAKPMDKRKRKRNVTAIEESNKTLETSVNLEETPRRSNSPISNAAGVALLNESSSSSSKVTNGVAALPSQTNRTLDNNLLTVKNTSTLFHSLCYSEDVLSALPNRTWAIHSTEEPERRIVVSAMMMHNSQGTGLAPLYIKQIIFDERLNFDVLLANSRIVLKDKPTTIATMHDFEDLLDYVDSLKVCVGGPPISQYSRVNPECAYRDSMNHWRHNLCSLEINNGEVCESCNSLDEILRRYAQRTKTAVKSAGKRKR